MATATAHRPLHFGISARISHAVHVIAEERQKRRLYKRTLNELRALSTRELADLGLSRANLNSVAYEAAYGN